MEDPKCNANNDSIVCFFQFLCLRHDQQLDGTADVTKAQKKFETDIKITWEWTSTRIQNGCLKSIKSQ